MTNKNLKDMSTTSPNQQIKKPGYRPKGGSIDPKGSWNYQNQAYTSNMAFNVAYNTFNSQKNSFMQIYTNKKQRQEIYQKHLFDKFVSTAKGKDRKSMMSTMQPPDKNGLYNKNRKKGTTDIGSVGSAKIG